MSVSPPPVSGLCDNDRLENLFNNGLTDPIVALQQPIEDRTRGWCQSPKLSHSNDSRNTDNLESGALGLAAGKTVIEQK